VDERVGGTTCGKPYGFAAEDNCGISYFPIGSKASTLKAMATMPMA
jgi:hypothetical protein